MKTALSTPEGAIPTFAAFVASRIPHTFAEGVRYIIDSSCDEAFSKTDEPEDAPYWKNVQPHVRNKLACERLHHLADQNGIKATAKTLDNGYVYLELEVAGLTIHVKHLNNHQPIREQMVKADYRREMTTINSAFGQMSLFSNGEPAQVPDEAFLMLFYADSDTSKGEVGSIFFVLPSHEHGVSLETCEIEAVIAQYPASATIGGSASDEIDLPPQDQDDEDNKAAQ